VTCYICQNGQLVVKDGTSHLCCPNCNWDLREMPATLVHAELSGLTEQDVWRIKQMDAVISTRRVS
jgi:hypothetical protein